MITEDYVSFETAKLLKEKGFDCPGYRVRESHGDSQTLLKEIDTTYNSYGQASETAIKYYSEVHMHV